MFQKRELEIQVQLFSLISTLPVREVREEEAESSWLWTSIFIHKSECEVSSYNAPYNSSSLQEKGVENAQVLEIFLKKWEKTPAPIMLM